jgi:hypothetical protein
MSWLYSRALVAEYSAACCSAGVPSVPSNTTHTPQAFYSHGKMTGFSRLSRFGMMFAPLTDAIGEELLTWFRAAFPARTFPPPVRAQALTANALDSGKKWHESSLKFDPDTCSWKTHQCLWEEDLLESSVTLPRRGLMQNGVVYQLENAERRTSETESGLWPTPTVSGNNNRKGISTKAGDGLATAVLKAETFPTPTATAAKGWSRNHNRAATNDRLDYQIEREADQSGKPGRLNPTWVEWLMGWPQGWTELKPLAMDKFQEWQQQHLLR